MSKDHFVAVVTGASRGAGKGIALALGDQGATVYVTGRTGQEGSAPLPGTVYATADEVTRRGGKGIAVICDHGDDEQVRALFEQVEREQGRLDILVNNALYVPEALVQPGPFWTKPLELQAILERGMSSTYVATCHAAARLARVGHEHGRALVVNTSLFVVSCYMHGPSYGAVKAVVDNMALPLAVDFRPYNMAAGSL